MLVISLRILHLLRHQIFGRLFAVHHHHSTNSADLPSLISNLILNHPIATTATIAYDGDAASLSLTISSFSLSPSVVDDVLKHLWNNGPRALLFFRALLLLLSYSPSPCFFDLAIDTIVCLCQDLRSFNSLLYVLYKSRRFHKAISLFQFFKTRFCVDVITYNILADGWCHVKRTAATLNVLKEMVDFGLEPTLTTYNILLKGFFCAGQVKEGWKFFLHMKKRGRPEASYCLPDVISCTMVVHGLSIS